MLVQVLSDMMRLHQRMDERESRKDMQVMDDKLKLEQKMKKITCVDSISLMEEIEEFEKLMQKNMVSTWRVWYRYFESALEEGPRQWIDGSHTREPGKSPYQAALTPNAPDDAWAVVYRLARGELMRKVGMAYDSPADQAQAMWDSIVFPADPSADEITKVFERLNRARIKMVNCGRIDDSKPDSRDREMADLKKKIPLGSALRFHLYSRDHEPINFDSFFNEVQKYQVSLKKSEEKAGRGMENEFGSDGWPSSYDQACLHNHRRSQSPGQRKSHRRRPHCGRPRDF